jgi:small-conductance mechanosensitive channel
MFLDQELFHNSLQRWLIAVAVFLLCSLFLKIFVRQLYQRLKKFAGRTKTYVDDMVVELLSRIKMFFLSALALYLAALILQLPSLATAIISKLVIIALVFQAAIGANSLISLWMNRYKTSKPEAGAAGITNFSVIGFVAKIILWSVVLLLILDNLGINITALVAGLGVGGIAVALAVQNILVDLIASFSIVLDKPFVIGDFIIIDSHMGTVEHIGLKTTRVRSLSGEQLIFSNTDLLQSRIRNFKRMNERRVLFTVGVTYETAPAKLQKIPGLLREIVTGQKNTRFERAHFRNFGDFALVFEVVYWVLVPDYNIYMDIQQSINFQIHDRFRGEQIEFAYPTQTLILSRPAVDTSPGDTKK